MGNYDCCKTRDELAKELNIPRKSLTRKLREKGIVLPRTHYLTPKEYREIYKSMGIKD